MSAGHREYLDRRCSAPVIAWLIDNGYVADDCGVLDVTAEGKRYIRDGLMCAHRETRGAVPVTIHEQASAKG